MTNNSREPPRLRSNRGTVVVLLLCNALVLQLGGILREWHRVAPGSYPILEAPAVPLPSVRISGKEEQEVQSRRKEYGGTGDKSHLGGFTEIDMAGISPTVWKSMVQYFGIKSLLDVGCGRGISTSWFQTHGVRALCVEGSRDAVQRSILVPDKHNIIEHDFSRGPWWPTETVDAVWCVEFLEHVGRNFHHHILPAFQKAAFLFVTHSEWGGWHHVEVHDDSWWQMRMESLGFVYSAEATGLIRRQALVESKSHVPVSFSSTTQFYNAQHIWLHMQVFINPTVASRPEHAHLLAEPGCFAGQDAKKETLREFCGTGKDNALLTPLPQHFHPLELTEEMDKAWDELLQRHIHDGSTKGTSSGEGNVTRQNRYLQPIA